MVVLLNHLREDCIGYFLQGLFFLLCEAYICLSICVLWDDLLICGKTILNWMPLGTTKTLFSLLVLVFVLLGRLAVGFQRSFFKVLAVIYLSFWYAKSNKSEKLSAQASARGLRLIIGEINRMYFFLQGTSQFS